MTGGLEKQGRIERVKERKERGKAREVNKVLTGWGTLASCPRQEETRDKRVPVAVAGSGPLAGKLAPEYPEWSGCQSRRRRVPARVTICCRKRDPFQGLKLGSCLTLGNELSKETHVLTKGTWSGCLIRGQKMISQTQRTVPKSKVPSECQPTWKVGHSAVQKVITLFFLISTLRS